MQPYLADALHTRAVLNTYSFAFQKRLGQNFLIDKAVPEGIVRAAGLTKEDVVLEIGPGIGTMTQYLAEAAGKVIAVEVDEKLLPILADTLASWHNVRVIHQDILKTDLAALLSEESPGRPVKVVANLPYYITSLILMKLLENRAYISQITVMVQEEVAQRIAAGPGTKAYGALSLSVQYYARPEIALHVAPHSFMPQPEVSSAVVNLTRYEQPPVEVKDEAFLFSLIRASFLQRRKTLVNALLGSPQLGLKKENILHTLMVIGKDPLVRGETFTLEDFAAFADALDEIRSASAEDAPLLSASSAKYLAGNSRENLAEGSAPEELPYDFPPDVTPSGAKGVPHE